MTSVVYRYRWSIVRILNFRREAYFILIIKKYFLPGKSLKNIMGSVLTSLFYEIFTYNFSSWVDFTKPNNCDDVPKRLLLYFCDVLRGDDGSIFRPRRSVIKYASLNLYHHSFCSNQDNKNHGTDSLWPLELYLISSITTICYGLWIALTARRNNTLSDHIATLLEVEASW